MVRTVDLRFILMQSSNRLKIRMLQSHHLISNIPGNTTSCWRIWPRVKNHKQCNFISCTPLISRDLKNIPGFNYDLLCERHTTTGYVLKRLTMHLSISIAVSGVFKGRRARHLPRAPPFWRPPWGVTRIHFRYFWWKFYHPLIPKQIKGFMQIDFFRFTRPIRYGSRWKGSTFLIIDCVLQQRWAKALPSLQRITGSCVLLAQQVVMKTGNVFQMAWNQRRTLDAVALFMIFYSRSDSWTRSGVAD